MLKMGMVGGGPGSMIGDIHRMAAQATGKAKLVCGAFSSDPQRNLEKGSMLGLTVSRIYDSVEAMLLAEKELPEGERMDFLAITTPNHLHVDAAIMALEAGFHVMCDKPLGMNLAEAIRLEQVVKKNSPKFAMTYTYRGYAAIRRMVEEVAKGTIGQVRKILVDYSQGWLSQLVELEGNKQAAWRTDPDYSGAGGTIADIGTHGFNLVEYLTNQKVASLSAQVSTLVKGRRIDDDANILLQFEGGATGVLSVSQVCTGEDNALRVRIYGDEGGMSWHHEAPARLEIKGVDHSKIVDIEEIDIDLSKIMDLLPPGHPDSFMKAFITLYDDFFSSISTGMSTPCPGIVDGVRGMLFIEKAIESSQKKQWVDL